MSVEICGYSDDTIEIHGDLREEHDAIDSHVPRIITLTDASGRTVSIDIVYAPAGDGVWRILDAVMTLGRSGSITLKLTVSQQDDASVLVHPTISVKAPQPASRAQHFYVDAERRLALADPYRPQLPFPTHDLTGDTDR